MLIGYIQFRFEGNSKYFANCTVMSKYSFHEIIYKHGEQIRGNKGSAQFGQFTKLTGTFNKLIIP